ncbi:MAG: DUF29 family protein [Prochlorothrix sp.]|nr:DUF29 family protein [Prochlorothrix sp.]
MKLIKKADKEAKPLITLSPVKSQLTLEDFLALPETKPCSEYVDGKIEQKPMPHGEHSVIQTFLSRAPRLIEVPTSVSGSMEDVNLTLYDQDFYTWTEQQAQALAQRRVARLDWDHLAEELTDLGNRHYDQLISRLAILIGHLLKWKYQSERQSSSWRATIREQRRKIARLLHKNPGLKRRWQEAWEEAWLDGRDLAIRETGLDDAIFPEVPCFEAEQVCHQNYWP